ncbi:MAG: hypothetical protein M3O90_07010 [Actinomycetota bacterium]|nr:hypothetical protein [Actinomycetota bacterium]
MRRLLLVTVPALGTAAPAHAASFQVGLVINRVNNDFEMAQNASGRLTALRVPVRLRPRSGRSRALTLRARRCGVPG